MTAVGTEGREMTNPVENLTSVLGQPRDVVLAAETWSTPAIVVAEGYRLIVAADRSGVVRGFDGTNLDVVWSINLGAEITASPSVIDPMNDGQPAVAIGTHAGDLVVLDVASGRDRWRRQFGDAIRSTVAAADIDGNGALTLFVGVYGPTMVALRGDGGERWRRRLPNHLFGGAMKRGIVSSPLVCDVDRDGSPEVVIGVRSARMFCLDARTGALKWFAKLGYDPDSSPSFLLSGSEQPLVVFGGGEHTGGDGDNAIIALDGRTGQRVWTTDVGGGVDSSPMLLDRPGRSPLLFACSLARPAVVCVDSWSGATVWRYDFDSTPFCSHGIDHCCRPADGSPYFTERAICRSYTTPLIADLDNDGRYEIVAGSNNGDLVVLDADSGALRQRVRTGGIVRGSAVVADVDGDGLGEVVAVSGERVLVFQTKHRGKPTMMFKGRADHLGSQSAPPPVVETARRPPPWYMPLAVFWRLGVEDAARHFLLKLDERVLRRFGLRLFRYGY